MYKEVVLGWFKDSAGIFLEGLRKTMKEPVRIIGVAAKSWTFSWLQAWSVTA
jgi:hypothetical protein